MPSRTVLVAILLLNAGPSFGAPKIWFLHGHVVDHEGHPVAGASVTTVWSANGVPLERLRKVENDGREHPEFAMNEGRMEPWGNVPAQTDANGNFSIELRSSNDYKLMAIDKERKRGALIIFNPRHPPARAECKLVPLIRVYGRIRVAATGEPTRDVTVLADLPLNEEVPLGGDRLCMCSSAKSRFEFWLPPGKYQFEAFGHDPPRLESSDPHSINLTTGMREFDCGVFDLTPMSRLMYRFQDAKKEGTWRDYTQRYGQPCPAWHAVDARGIGKGAQPANFRGKWLLVYFWGTGCPPCIERTLPKLREFYEAHKTHRDRFEVVAICSEVGTKIHTMTDFDREMRPFVKAVWNGKELPFPLLLDNSPQSMENFGVEMFGTTLLVDPTGRLVPGDELTLAAILKEGDRTKTPRE
jgi:thiol-disulfide isomerase/thioredoxin